MLQQFQIRPPHKNFRLVLISTPFENLNEEITSYCHKYLIEQPSGIKNQMQYLREVSTVSLVHPTHKKLEFVITYLHAIINNLSKYKPYGWNLKYEFHTTDYLNSLQTLKEVAESALELEKYECNIDLEEEKEKLKADEIDFKALRYMLGEIGYVGKLADDIDRAKMKIIIDQFINPAIFSREASEGELAIHGVNFRKLDLSNLQTVIDGINENDAAIFGLHPAIKPLS
jgi:dynein heavy chain, axonemal